MSDNTKNSWHLPADEHDAVCKGQACPACKSDDIRQIVASVSLMGYWCGQCGEIWEGY